MIEWYNTITLKVFSLIKTPMHQVNYVFITKDQEVCDGLGDAFVFSRGLCTKH